MTTIIRSTATIREQLTAVIIRTALLAAIPALLEMSIVALAMKPSAMQLRDKLVLLPAMGTPLAERIRILSAINLILAAAMCLKAATATC